MTETPKQWGVTSLEEACGPEAPIIYGILQPGPDTPGGVPYVRPTEITDHGIRLDQIRRTTPEIATKYRRSTLQTGDLLLSIVGTIGKVATVPPELDGGNITQSSCRIRPEPEIYEPSFVAHFLRSPQAIGQYGENRLGTAVPRLNLADVRTITAPLPPLPEQRRIVAKLDRLSARSAAAREHLARTTKLATRAKQAIRGAAFDGSLTSDWREAFDSPIPEFRPLESVCASLTDGDHQAPPKADEGIAFITISAINDGYLRLEKATRYVPQSYRDGLKHTRQAVKGDILFSVTGSIAIPALVETYEPFVFQRHIAILKPDHDAVTSRYLLHILGATQVKEQALAVATGTAQLTIPLGKLRKFSIPIPPLEEQAEIVRRIDAAFARIDRITEDASRAAHLLDRLDERLLAKAFRGELVPQDPEDEPAEALLARIREAREAAPKARRGRRKKAEV